MIRAFVDASVIYSAIYSPTGGSRELFRRHRLKQIQLVTSQYALDEVKRNILQKAPELALAIEAAIATMILKLLRPLLKPVKKPPPIL